MAKANYARAQDLSKRIGKQIGTELEVLKTVTTDRTISGLSLSKTHYALVSEQGIIITGTLAEVLATLVGIEFVITEAVVRFS